VLAWLSVWTLNTGANNLHMVQLIPLPICHTINSRFINIQIGLTFLVPAYPGCTGKDTLNGCLFLHFA